MRSFIYTVGSIFFTRISVRWWTCYANSKSSEGAWTDRYQSVPSVNVNVSQIQIESIVNPVLLHKSRQSAGALLSLITRPCPRCTVKSQCQWIGAIFSNHCRTLFISLFMPGRPFVHCQRLYFSCLFPSDQGVGINFVQDIVQTTSMDRLS